MTTKKETTGEEPKRHESSTYNLDSCLEKLAARQFTFPEKIISRLRELQGTGHDLHTYEMMASAEELAKELSLSEEETKILSAATLMHDIGKTGPLGLPPEERAMIINFFHYLKNIDRPAVTAPIADLISGRRAGAEKFINETNRADYYGLLRHPAVNYVGYGTLLEFFRLHIGWTHEVLKKELAQNNPDNSSITAVASLHHFTEGKNPGQFNLLEPENNNAQMIARLAKILIVLDKYNAHLRRGKKKLTDALDSTGRELEDSTKNLADYKNKPALYDKLIEEFNEIIAALKKTEPQRLPEE